MEHFSDKQLFDNLRSGNQEALSILFLRHYSYLRHYGIQIIPRITLVEGCIQELFIYMFQSFDRFSDVKYVKAYLFKSLRRRILEAIKKEDKIKMTVKNNPHFVDFQFSPADLKSSVTHQSEVNEELTKVLNELPWRQREAIYLRYYNGLRTKEIAEIMGVANQTILNTLYQALKKLRINKNLRNLID